MLKLVDVVVDVVVVVAHLVAGDVVVAADGDVLDALLVDANVCSSLFCASRVRPCSSLR